MIVIAMELIITIISLMWVMGILTLQRLDAVIDDFSKALAYYLSLEPNGATDLEQLSVKSLLPRAAITALTKELIRSTDRKDKGGLKKALKFFEQSKVAKLSLEALLVIATISLPLIYWINFSGVGWLTFMDKDFVSFALLFAIALLALMLEPVLTRLSEKYYPISVVIGE